MALVFSLNKNAIMIKDVKNLKQRLITSSVMLPLFIFPIYWGGLIYQFFLIFLSTLIFFELLLITKHKHGKISIILYVFFLLISVGLLNYFSYIVCLCIYSFITFAIIIINKLKSYKNWLPLSLLISYIPFIILNEVRSEANFPDGLLLTLFIIAIAIISDVSGYFGGQICGKKKIFPYISPNKTLEGTFFALIMPSVIILPIIIAAHIKLNIYLLFVMIIFMSAGAILGDLLASFIKRNFDVKNSSNLLPGHGGVIDRLDSVIGSSLVFIIMIFIFKIINLSGIELISVENLI